MLKNFFSGYSQNGAAQAIVVLSALTVAAEVIRTRSTGKRPYRDYGVGGMNEHDPDHDGYPMAQMGGVPHDLHETMIYGMGAEAQDYGHPMDMGMDDHGGDDMDVWAEMQEVEQESRRMAAQGQSWSEGARQQMGRQQVSRQQMGRQQMGRQQMGRQQVSRQQVHMQHEDVEGSMAREASPWNRYVAIKVPELVAQGMSAPQAMKAASKTFLRDEARRLGSPEPKKVKRS